MDNKKQRNSNGFNEAQEKIKKRYTVILYIASFLITLSFAFVGVFIYKRTGIRFENLIIPASICFLLPLIFFLCSPLFQKAIFARIKKMNVAQTRDYILSHRIDAEKTSQEKMKVLCRIKLLSDIYTVFLALLSACGSVIFGITADIGFISPLFLYMLLLMLSCLARIPFSLENTFFVGNNFYVEEKDFPELYALAYKAQKAIGCEGTIKIALLNSDNAGITKIGNTFSLQFGVILLNVLSKDEAYTILLHEFSHTIAKDKKLKKHSSYYYWIEEEGFERTFRKIRTKLFCFFDSLYIFQYELFKFSASLIEEEKADRNMAELGNKEAAASALLKTNYCNLYSWEDSTADFENIFAVEELPYGLVAKGVNDFINKIPERKDDWNKLTKIEILSAAASHPTTKMRLEALGFTDYNFPEYSSPAEYTAELKKAVDYLEEPTRNFFLDEFDDCRERYYLEPKKTVDEWEKNGEQITIDGYADVIVALESLGRYSDAEKLCDRVLSTESKSITKFASFKKGIYMLHRYDAGGLDYIYNVMSNSNFIDDGLSHIGSFCRLTGNQKELDSYREKAVNLCQKQADEYIKLSFLLPTDNLSAEHLPKELEDGITAFIGEIDNNNIDSVYIVRKTISETFFTSAVVIRFDKNANNEATDDILHKMFRYLDTCSDWQFSLFNYNEIKEIKFEQFDGSCIYSGHKNNKS